MRRRSTVRAVAAASVLWLTASCGGSGGGGTPAGQQGGYADLKGQALEVAAEWGGTEQARFGRVLELFKQRTHATVKYTSTGDDLSTVIGTRLRGGKPPDVVILPNPSLLGHYVRQRVLTPANAQVQAAVDHNFAPVWKELGSVGGKPYGVWFKATDKSTVWYRTAAFDQAGVQEPKTWDDFLRAAQTLADSGTTPLSLGGGDGWTLTDWFENVYLRAAGPAKYDQLTRHEIAWTDDSVKTALTMLARLWARKDLVIPHALQTDFPTSVTQVFADNPHGAIVFEADFVAGVILADQGEGGHGREVLRLPVDQRLGGHRRARRRRRRRVHRLPRCAGTAEIPGQSGGGRGVGQAGRLPVGQQGTEPSGVPGRHHPEGSADRGRCWGGLAVRHVGPDAGRLR
jgi:alpha-glucoside transport system substrate-binding protein